MSITCSIAGKNEVGVSISDNTKNFQNTFNEKKKGQPPKIRIVFHIYAYAHTHTHINICIQNILTMYRDILGGVNM